MAGQGDGALQRLVQGGDARPKRFLRDGQPNPAFREEDQSIRDVRMKTITRWKAGMEVTTTDRELIDAMFLHKNNGWKPEDLGYPPRDYILIDLMRQLG